MNAIDSPDIIGASWGLKNVFFGKPTRVLYKNMRGHILYIPSINLFTDDKYTLGTDFNYGF